MAGVDAVVVGGGPAGLAAAIALRRAGLSAMVADVYEPPVDKICGEGILPEGLAALAELGICLPPDSGIPFRGISFIDSACSFQAAFVGAPAFGIRRTVLHGFLA
jgi:flavin-dependent dehydrogenase